MGLHGFKSMSRTKFNQVVRTVNKTENAILDKFRNLLRGSYSDSEAGHSRSRKVLFTFQPILEQELEWMQQLIK